MSWTMAAIARDGKLKAKHCLKIWGEAKRGQLVEPDAWGWPSSTIEARLREQGHGAKEAGAKPEMTAPEAAVDRLNRSMTIAHWTNCILRDLPYKTRVVAFHYWRDGLCWADISASMSEVEDTPVTEVEAHYRRILRAVKEGLSVYWQPSPIEACNSVQ
jgi:hypothetical protein